MPFKDISYLQFWWPFFSAERNRSGNLVEDIMRTISVKLF